MNLSFEEFQKGNNYYQEIQIRESGKEHRLTHATVLLLWFCQFGKRVKNFAEIGCGSGYSTLWIARHKNIEGTGIDKQAELQEIFENSAKDNGLGNKVRFIASEIKDIHHILKINTFDLVVFNPPHYEESRGKAYTDPERRINRAAEDEMYDDYCQGVHFLLRQHGIFCAVLAPQNLPTWFSSFDRYRLVVKKICFAYGRQDKPAQLVLIKGLKDARKGFLEVLPPVFLQNKTPLCDQ